MTQIIIIAEIGINHSGNLEIAKQLIDMAKDCGADLVKFQKREIDIVYSEEELSKPRESPWGTTTREQKQGLEFGKDEYNEINTYCQEKFIPWFASAWDLESLKFLDDYGCTNQKIASAMMTELEFCKEVAKRKKHTFISTGMCSMGQIDRVVDLFTQAGCPYTLMHSTSVYPCRDEDTNILMVRNLLQRYGPPIGYSGHEVGLLPSILAVALGATVIERHITRDRSMYGSDQSASLEKRGLELLVKDCRGVAAALGDGRKQIIDSEQDVARKLRYFENG